MILETLYIIGRNLLWQSAFLTAIVFCVLYMLPRSQITARYRVALSGLFSVGFLLAVPFLPDMSFGLNLTPEFLQPANEVMPITTALDNVARTLAQPEITSAIAEPISRAPFTMDLVLVLIWLAGSGVGLFRLGYAARQGRYLSRGFVPVQIKNTSNLSRPVTIVRSAEIGAPLVFGLLKPTIVVPENFSLDLDDPETLVILEHEIAHIVRGDLWVNLAQRALLATLWWCLPLYWINRQIGAERENLCDALATAHLIQSSPSAGNPARMLAGALVRFAEQKSQIQAPGQIPILAIGIHPHAALLAQRVQRLCDSNPVPRLSKKLMLSSSLAIPATLLILSVMTPRALADSPQKSTPLAGKPVISAPAITAAVTPLPTKEVKIVDGRLTSKYGFVRKRFDGKIHTGIDIANKLGTPIYAPADARVIEATDTYKNSTKWGKTVVIETAGGVQTIFAHMKNYNVTVGQTVKAGEQIGQMGNTGASTGPHVHIETHINGRHVDPLTVWDNLPH